MNLFRFFYGSLVFGNQIHFKLIFDKFNKENIWRTFIQPKPTNCNQMCESQMHALHNFPFSTWRIYAIGIVDINAIISHIYSTYHIERNHINLQMQHASTGREPKLFICVLPIFSYSSSEQQHFDYKYAQCTLINCFPTLSRSLTRPPNATWKRNEDESTYVFAAKRQNEKSQWK